MKGILLAGGSGTRLHPTTMAVSKQLLPIGDKPMVYYPLSLFLLAGVQDVLLISTPHDLPQYQQLLGDGAWCGLRLQYAVQPEPKGLAQAYTIGESFLDGEPSMLVLGDNVFHGSGLTDLLAKGAALKKGGLIYGYRVADPERYGVVAFTEDGKVTSIEEKPKHPKSNYAIPGLYFYDGRAPEFAKQAKASERGEYEITEIHNAYLADGSLSVELMPRGIAWLDTGTYEAMHEASSYVMAVQHRTGMQIACLEGIALEKGYVNEAKVRERLSLMGKSHYRRALEELI